MEVARTSCRPVAYRRAGSGPPLLLLHGGMSDHREWQAQIDGLSDELTVIAWDAPGAGGSFDPPDGFGIADYADAAAGLVEHLGLPPVHVAGLSWGGVVAQVFTRRHPQRVRSLILADTYAGWKGSLTPGEVRRRLDGIDRDLEGPIDSLIDAWLPTLMTDAGIRRSGAALAAIMRDFRPGGTRVMARTMAETDERQHLSKIRVPTLLLWGDDDRRSPLDVAAGFHEAIPDSTLLVIPACGHQSNMDQPGRFNDAVRAWCRSH